MWRRLRSLVMTNVGTILTRTTPGAAQCLTDGRRRDRQKSSDLGESVAVGHVRDEDESVATATVGLFSGEYALQRGLSTASAVEGNGSMLSAARHDGNSLPEPR